MEQLALFDLGHLEHESAKYAVREFRPKMEQLAQFYLGHLEHESAKYAVRAVRPKMEQLARKVWDTWNIKER
ncbi:hypothetical protein KI387_015004, partial [Taxus chinensis]